MEKRKQLEHTLLIVCEGEHTEPAYFQSIKDIVQKDLNIWQEGINITISPIPKFDNEKETHASLKINHKKKRKQRKLQAARTIIQNEIEEEYKAEPVRYVREAQLGLEMERMKKLGQFLILIIENTFKKHLM